jgi:tRNA pseudouridine38-40 synthase
MLKRFFFEIAYNGSTFHGWQKQPNEISVQEEIENAFLKLNSNSPIPIVGCGRTDTGVHAKHYIFHVDLSSLFKIDDIVFKLNRILPSSIVVHKFYEVESELHARFHAKSRTYRYFINFQKEPFKLGTSWYLSQNLNFDAMNAAASLLIGTKDFTSFSKVNTDVKTNICSVSQAKWHKVDEYNWFFEITADRFLRNMVRATVGTLLEVGQGKMKSDEITFVLEAKSRSAAAVSVPAHGLFLWEIKY